MGSSARSGAALRRALAQALQMPEAQIHTVHADGAGCYGHNGADDAALDALKRGEIVIVVDDEDRENEGDFIVAAEINPPELPSADHVALDGAWDHVLGLLSNHWAST